MPLKKPIPVLLLFLLASGCTYYTPKPLPVAPHVHADITIDKELAVENVQTSSANQDLFADSVPVHHWFANYTEWTDVAAAMLREALTGYGATIVDSSPHLLKVSVISARGYENTLWTVREIGSRATVQHALYRHTCRLALRVETGFGYQNVYEGRADEPSALAACFDNSLKDAVVKMFNDPNIVSYLEAPN